jgi:hypothetical protein
MVTAGIDNFNNAFGTGITLVGLTSVAVAIWLVAFIRPGAD